MLIVVELLCEYLKESNFNKDGSPSDDDSYYKVVQIKTERPLSAIREEVEKDGWCTEMSDSDDVYEILNLDDYVEGTLEARQVSFSEVTMEEAEKKGYLFAVSEIRKGKKVFRMNVCGNIYSENGKLLYYNIEPCRIVSTL